MAGKTPRSAFMPWRYALFLFLCLTAFGLSIWLPWYQAIMAGFDVAALGYAVTLRPLFRLDAEGIRKRARPEDADRVLLLALTAITMITILTAVTAELTQGDAPKGWSVALVICTLAIAWCFSNMIYAIHHAHLFYDDSQGGVIAAGSNFRAHSPPITGISSILPTRLV
jgi:uncharacterized membrane protein